MTAAGAAGQLRVAAGQLPDDAFLQLGGRVSVQERLQRAAAAAVAAHVDQLSWRQVSDTLRKIPARFLVNRRSMSCQSETHLDRWCQQLQPAILLTCSSSGAGARFPNTVPKISQRHSSRQDKAADMTRCPIAQHRVAPTCDLASQRHGAHEPKPQHEGVLQCPAHN